MSDLAHSQVSAGEDSQVSGMEVTVLGSEVSRTQVSGQEVGSQVSGQGSQGCDQVSVVGSQVSHPLSGC